MKRLDIDRLKKAYLHGRKHHNPYLEDYVEDFIQQLETKLLEAVLEGKTYTVLSFEAPKEPSSSLYRERDIEGWLKEYFSDFLIVRMCSPWTIGQHPNEGLIPGYPYAYISLLIEDPRYRPWEDETEFNIIRDCQASIESKAKTAETFIDKEYPDVPSE